MAWYHDRGVRKNGKTVMGGDGQVSMGSSVMSNAKGA